jgi:hypothetical protein
MKTSRRYIVGSIAVAVAVFGGGITGASSAWAQQKGKTLKQQVVGTWVLVSAENTSPDGSKSYPFGPTPKGRIILDASGNVVVLNINPALPKIASNSRATGTPEENKAIVSQSLGLMGTYTVNEAEKTMVWHVEASTFANWVDQDLKRPISSITANEMAYINPASSVGTASTLLKWKRLK